MYEKDHIELSVILPVYNEADKLEKNIKVLYEYLHTMGVNFEIIISNDGSTDKSPQIAKGISEQLKNVYAIAYKTNKGRGYAIKYCEKYLNGNLVMFMDTDFASTIDLAYLEKMYALLKQYDIVIASRFHRDAKIKRKCHRAFVSFAYRMIVKIVFRGFKVTDPDVGFKGFRRNVFREVIKYTDLDGWSWDLQFLVNAFNFGFSIKEFPFNWVESYERTTVNIIKDSLFEFIGLIYIKIKSVYDYIKWNRR